MSDRPDQQLQKKMPQLLGQEGENQLIALSKFTTEKP
jgi:hypothetical protein